MLRHKSLIPLSRQHQHALALCVRIERAAPIPGSELGAWQAEITQHFRSEIRIHFVAEEQFVFPVAQLSDELVLLVEELLSEHAWLRERFAGAEGQQLSSTDVSEFARRLSEHIRKEERQLFERLQQLVSTTELAKMGHQVEGVLQEAEHTCGLPARAAAKQKKE